MTEDNGDLGVIPLVAATISVVKIAKEILSPKSGESTMIAIPNYSDMDIYVLIAAIAFAFFFGICAFLYRYAEHNAKHDLDRDTNKLFGKDGLKFVGAELMAIALTAVLAYYGAAITPPKLGILEPELLDYIIAAGIIALIAGLLLTILFNEGISGLGKFIKQKADETVIAITVASEAVMETIEAAQKAAKEMGLNKKQTKKYVEMRVAEVAAAEAEAETPLEEVKG